MSVDSLTLSAIILLAAAATQLPLGVCLGWWFFQRRHAAQLLELEPRGSLHARRAADSLAKLHGLASQLASQAGEHAQQIQSIHEQLVQAAANGDEQLHESLLGAMKQILELNAGLHQQLMAAEDQLKLQAEKLESQVAEARTDALTGLSNRRAFDAELDRKLQVVETGSASVSLMLIDIDHFKKFNDQYGHQAGDEVLRSVARVLYGAMREVDIVARYGGEEFAVILPNTDLESARVAAERARRAVELGHYEFENQQFQVTISGGVAEAKPGEERTRLLGRADAALYASKAAGRNCAFVHDGEICHPITTLTGKYTASDSPAPTASGPEAASASSETPEEPPTEPIDPLLLAKEADWRTDPLTGLPSRKAFDEDLKRGLAQHRRYGAPLSLAVLDVDNFEELAAYHGHETTSVILRAVTQFLQTAMRDADFVSRYDEKTFTITLPGTSLENSVRAAERIRGAISLCRLRLNGHDIQFTISAGVAEATEQDTAESLVERAEQALSSAVNAGRNRTCLHNGRRCFPSQLVLAPAAVG